MAGQFNGGLSGYCFVVISRSGVCRAARSAKRHQSQRHAILYQIHLEGVAFHISASYPELAFLRIGEFLHRPR
jgi:hypothetical protein